MSKQASLARVKWFVIVLLLTIVEIGPIPLMGLTLLYILAKRPIWFKELIDRIYS